MYLRLDTNTFAEYRGTFFLLIVLIPVALLSFHKMGLYRTVFRYVSVSEVRSIAIAICISAVSLPICAWLLTVSLPRSVPLIYGLTAFLIVAGSRYFTRSLILWQQASNKVPVIIYGAGQSGRQLAGSLREGPDYAPIAFVDDDPRMHMRTIAGSIVYPSDRIGELAARRGAKIVLLAMPSISASNKAAILKRLEPLPLHIQTMPGMADIVAGRAKLNDIAEISTEDLLGRDAVSPLDDLLVASLDGHAIMITGAGGSIGSELCRQIIRFSPSVLVLFDSSEFALYSIDQDLQRLLDGKRIKIVTALGSVRDRERMEALMRSHGVTTVFHAAAYKHVPLVEHNVVEGIRNNVFGTMATLQAAIAAGVTNFTLISTDKAVRPPNVMGASKRLAELICQAHAVSCPDIRIAMVRFGNVLGSSGSVIPAFRRQIDTGGPITVTHREVTRYFMTIPEAAQLVVQASAIAEGGDVFLLDMGEPVRIAELAQRLARLSGFQPVIAGEAAAPDDPRPLIEIVFTSLRPGEKLYEELLISADARGTEHPRIMRATEEFLPLATLADILDRLEQACIEADETAVRNLLVEAKTGYTGLNRRAEERPMR